MVGAGADSHLSLPTVGASRAALDASDFEPFRHNRDLPAAMTAHVVYSDIDPERPATISPTVIEEVVRRTIGFHGLLFSDDLSMKALPGTFREKAAGLYTAGVDIALHCNGDRSEAGEVAVVAPELTGIGAERVRKARAALRTPYDGFDPVDAAAMLDRALAAIT